MCTQVLFVCLYYDKADIINRMKDKFSSGRIFRLEVIKGDSTNGNIRADSFFIFIYFFY
jgi:hypothetical protein